MHTLGKNHCPARGCKCSKCDEMNHFARMCDSVKKFNSVHGVNYRQSDRSDSGSENKAAWIVKAVHGGKNTITCQLIIINRRDISFQVDTGASIS